MFPYLLLIVASTAVSVIASTAAPGVLDFAQLGIAGLMGTMWLYERRQGQKRDGQLDEAHDRIMADGYTIQELVRVVETNSRAMTQLAEKLDQ